MAFSQLPCLGGSLYVEGRFSFLIAYSPPIEGNDEISTGSGDLSGSSSSDFSLFLLGSSRSRGFVPIYANLVGALLPIRDAIDPEAPHAPLTGGLFIGTFPGGPPPRTGSSSPIIFVVLAPNLSEYLNPVLFY